MAKPRESQKIPRIYADALAAFLQDYMDRECDGVQREVERKTGVSQAHVSAMLHPGGRRGPGLEAVLRLREATGASLDDMFGIRRKNDPISDIRIAAQMMAKANEEIQVLVNETPRLPPKRNAPG